MSKLIEDAVDNTKDDENKNDTEILKDIEKERIIKSKVRVQKHGEVFTPKSIVRKMLDQTGIKESCDDLLTTFLEPSAGEGAFLAEVLHRKLNMVSIKYNETLHQYENYSLIALSTLYGVELLEDNAQICTQNMIEIFIDHYYEQIRHHNGKKNQKVLDSAKVIISANIAQGDYLSKLSSRGTPLIFSEWKPLSMNKTIKVIRTEYSIDEIIFHITKKEGESYTSRDVNKQISIFDNLGDADRNKIYRYIPTIITNVFKEEMEEINE